MWLFCKNGFFSAVAHNRKKGTVHVRARFGGDLERLCAAHGVKPDVVETPEGDYRYRMDFSATAWRRIVAAESSRIDYTNFKAAVHDGTPRDDAYMEVWMTLAEAGDANGGVAAERLRGVLSCAFKAWDADLFTAEDYDAVARVVLARATALVGEGRLSREEARRIDEEHRANLYLVHDVVEL